MHAPPTPPFLCRPWCVRVWACRYQIRSIPTISGDRIYCKVLAHNAVHAAFAGYTGVTMGLVNTHVSPNRHRKWQGWEVFAGCERLAVLPGNCYELLGLYAGARWPCALFTWPTSHSMAIAEPLFTPWRTAVLLPPHSHRHPGAAACGSARQDMEQVLATAVCTRCLFVPLTSTALRIEPSAHPCAHPCPSLQPIPVQCS